MKLPLLLMPLALAACAAPSGDPPDRDGAGGATGPLAQELPRYHWRLQDAHDRDGKRIDAMFPRPDRPLTLDFDLRRVAVRNACNRMGGGYTLEGAELTIGRMASSMMACADPKLMALDHEADARLQGRLQAALGPVDGDPGATGTGPRLQLVNEAGDVLRFGGEPTADTRYGGPGDTVFLEVAARTRPCQPAPAAGRECLQVREVEYDADGVRSGDRGEFRDFRQDIEGYVHEPGVRNVLRARRYRIPDPPADAPSHAYVLDMVVESEIVAH